MKPTERFSNRADEYARWRPSYPSEAVDAMGVAPGALVADIGAGTGISSELFLRRGCRVVAVEPNAAMRDKAASEFSTQLDNLKPTIDKAKEKIAGMSAAVKPMAEKAVKEAEDLVASARTKVTELKSAGSETWSKLKDEISPMIQEAVDAVKGLEQYTK